MDVAVSALRAQLSDYLGRVRDGEEIVVTDRGVPVARLIGVDAASTLERLMVDGIIGRPDRVERPRARGRPRARARQSVSPRVIEQRR